MPAFNVFSMVMTAAPVSIPSTKVILVPPEEVHDHLATNVTPVVMALSPVAKFFMLGGPFIAKSPSEKFMRDNSISLFSSA